MKVVVKSENVGVNFGCVASVHAASNGKRLHTTQTHPYGFQHAARRSARDWAEDNGHEVVLATSDEYKD